MSGQTPLSGEAPSIDRPALATRLRLPLWIAAVFLAIATATRLGLWWASSEGHQASAPTWLRAAATGSLADLQAAVWVVLPFAIYLALVPERWFGARWHRRLLTGGLGVACFVFYFVAVAEGFFFAEFDSRFNFVAVDYLMYPTEVGSNLNESYPLPAILAGVGVLAAATLVAGRRQIRAAFAHPASLGQRVAGAVGVALAAGLLTWAPPPALWRVSDDRVINEIAANGWGSFVRALAGSNAAYEGLYATSPPRSVYSRLHRLLAEPTAGPATFSGPDSIERPVAPSGPERRWNVVVVLEESLGAEFVGALHPRPASLTPRFDALAAEGVLWTRAYSTGNRTIRAIEATTASLPPLPGISIVRRPQSEHLFTLPELLREHGYQTLFVYGGRALFDGMGGYLTRNGVDRVVDQSDFPSGTFHTAWGVADEAIFDRALVEMDRMESAAKPFYTLVLSVSNHRPYLFPTDGIQPDPGLRRRENAVRYADFALGRFVDAARSHAFFDHTLFVLMGDHGARVYGAAEIPLASYEVPILFLAPGLLAPGRIDTLASSLDVPPSILARLGIGYESRFFGHDLFTVEPRHGRALMTHNSEIALLQGRRIAVLGLHGEERVFEVAGESFLPVVPLDRAARHQLRDAIAYFYGGDLVYRQQVGEPLPPPPEVTATASAAAPARSHS